MALDSTPQADIDARARDAVAPILTALRQRVELDEPSWAVVERGLVNAAFGGVRIGVAETVAQAREAGVEFHLVVDIEDVDYDEG